MKDYSLSSTSYFNCLDGRLESPLFGRKIPFLAKNCDDIYALRCAEYFEGITPENLAEYPALIKLFAALGEYLTDMLEERGDNFDIGDFEYDGNASVTDLLKVLSPERLVFERFGYLTDEDCPPAFSLKLSFNPVPDEIMEIALHGDVAVYAGEFRGVSPWNEKLLKKKWNYARDC